MGVKILWEEIYQGIFPRKSPLYCFSFNPWPYNVNNQLCKLNDITIQALSDPLACIIISDASIKNYVTILVSYIHSFNRPVIKICHHTVNVSTTEAELFTIRCGINQAVGIPYIKRIIVITDLLHTVKKIFNSSSHLYQIYSAAISCESRYFFNKDINNYIEFWDCTSNKNWLLHLAVNKDSKSFILLTSFPCKLSWDFNKKYDCDVQVNLWSLKEIIKQWIQMNMTMDFDSNKVKQPRTFGWN